MSMEKVANKQYESKNWPDLVDSDDSDVENEIDVEKLPPLEVGPGENRLQHTYCLWFSRKGTQRAAADYSKSLHVVGRCASVQQWWSLYSHLIRPTALKPYRELSLFKQGIKPMWEDPANSKGGQWVIRLRKNKIERAWENVCMAMLGEQFLVGDEICGIVLQTKYPNPSIQVACSPSRPIICIIYTRFVVQFRQCKIIIVTNYNKRNVYEFLKTIVIKIHCEMLSLLSRKCKFVNAPNELTRIGRFLF
ncbi:eukaryotic translation initiation factor 4E type 2 isoform X1 [Drosophila santomea]|uniref:eukaryotic translation initiation factor 4E type 2 isoform X1 n=1 Tax=Drosophila santomea TaxID=129105 RepID=UPI0019534ECF|nr:eukaryotic translation initiation factor 4E type 2 isoform X1 [Drosophila santomea]